MGRLTSRWEGDGESFALVVGLSSDGLTDTSREEYTAWQSLFAEHVERLLAAEHGYTHVSVEVTDSADVATLVAAGANRGEWEMRDALGADIWDDLCDRASEAAWAALP